jgi:hypothetical protein
LAERATLLWISNDPLLPKNKAGCLRHKIIVSRPHLPEGLERPWRSRIEPRETMMTRLISYRTKPEAAAGNAELVTAVFAELKDVKPAGLRYLTLRLDDDTFVHLVAADAAEGTSALTQLAAFQTFQHGVRERCAEPPLVREATIVGNYRMLNEG